MELDDLYQDLLLDHYRHPRHFGPVPDLELVAEEVNPSCGDHIRLAVRVENGQIASVRHESRGCAISVASASIMADYALGKTPGEFRATADRVIALLRGEMDLDSQHREPEDLVALVGVRQFPMRVKCATMCWHAMQKALDRIEGRERTGRPSSSPPSVTHST